MEGISLEIVIVGQDIVDSVYEVIHRIFPKMKTLNPVNHGKLGNLRTLTLLIRLSEETAIFSMRDLMRELRESNRNLLPMHCCDDTPKIFVFNRFAFKTN